MIRLSRKNSQLHESQLNLRLLSFLGYGSDLELSSIAELYGFSKVPPLQEEFADLLDPNRKNVLLHPRSKGSAREWGIKNYKELVRILPESEFKIFVGGTAEEGKQIGELLQMEKVNDITGKMSLAQYISFISKCQALVAASTGPLHIAASLGRTAIGLFTSRRPMHPGRWMPVGSKAHALVHDPNCADCASGKDCDCITRINPQLIVDLLKRT